MKKNLLSLFSGCGGMDIGFEGGFKAHKSTLNFDIHKDWVESEEKNNFLLKETVFETKFANDISSHAKVAWDTYFSNKRGFDLNETYRVDETNKCIYVTRELISQTSEEIKIVSDGVAEMAALDNRLLRNALLAETDWTGMSDVTMTSAMTTYRQALRDITAHADFPNLDDDDWPTKP